METYCPGSRRLSLGGAPRRSLSLCGRAKMSLFHSKPESFINWKQGRIRADGLGGFQVKQILFDEYLMLNLLPSLIFRFLESLW